MKFVVIGGHGLIGSTLVDLLGDDGHDAVAAGPRSGVDAVTGEGLGDALAGADAVIDVSNSPSFEDDAVLEFFRTATGNLLAAGRNAGVGHHVALSVVGCDRLPDSGYMRAKVAQEELIEGSPMPYTIIRATQFHEFVEAIADAAAEGDTIRVPRARIQPVAADEVAAAVGRAAAGAPVNGVVEVAGPETFRLEELIRQDLRARRPASRRERPRRALLRRRAGRRRPARGRARAARRDAVRGLALPTPERGPFSLLKRSELILEASHRVLEQQVSPAHPGDAQRGQLGERRSLG